MLDDKSTNNCDTKIVVGNRSSFCKETFIQKTNRLTGKELNRSMSVEEKLVTISCRENFEKQFSIHTDPLQNKRDLNPLFFYGRNGSPPQQERLSMNLDYGNLFSSLRS
jgi:hypothetical protein